MKVPFHIIKERERREEEEKRRKEESARLPLISPASETHSVSKKKDQPKDKESLRKVIVIEM